MRLTIAAVLIASSAAAGYVSHTQEAPAPLSMTARRNIAIDFMAEYPSWKYTLCNTPSSHEDD